ncbi:hypothetical protein HYN59_07040 [Flavobacterium album]|uniref:Peptidase E n=1 Tax=Flavobacterium album TaxID=2175091 RepID=A0A2S1QWY4_9FLAO|nr:DUF6702 family protein [Flavobacterium album]AWH84893.1 hypothetical protein HYN59_07040 [Flavobacterium album]
MKGLPKYLLLVLLAVTLSAAAAHKYYVAVFLIEYSPKKKELQMTSRIFIDDLEAAFIKKYNKKFYMGEKRELFETEEYLRKYFAENIHIKVDGKSKAIKYLAKEIENDILICYFTIPADLKIKSVEVSNTTLLDMYPEQQNIINTKINSNKKSLLLTNDAPSGLLEF